MLFPFNITKFSVWMFIFLMQNIVMVMYGDEKKKKKAAKAKYRCNSNFYVQCVKRARKGNRSRIII